LSSLLKSGLARCTYTYDFGDDWEHTVEIEKTQPAVDGEAYPRCIAGKGACPPEDCGGPWGYQHLLEVLADPTHPEYADQRTWVDEDFTPDHFDTVAPMPSSPRASGESRLAVTLQEPRARSFAGFDLAPTGFTSPQDVE
jgi:hypothetical protein